MENAHSNSPKSNLNAAKNAADAKASFEVGQGAAKEAAEKAANLARSHIDATQENVRAGLSIATEGAHRSVNGLHEMLTGDKAKEAMKLSAQHIEAISGAGSELSYGFQEISREWMSYAKQGADKWQSAFGALAQCHSPHEFFEVQSRLTKENLENFVASSRRISEISTGVTTKAAQKIEAAQQTHA